MSDTFEGIKLWHLREARTHIALDLLSSCESKHFMFLGNDFQLGEIKGKVQFSLYL